MLGHKGYMVRAGQVSVAGTGDTEHDIIPVYLLVPCSSHISLAGLSTLAPEIVVDRALVKGVDGGGRAPGSVPAPVPAPAPAPAPTPAPAEAILLHSLAMRRRRSTYFSQRGCTACQQWQAMVGGGGRQRTAEGGPAGRPMP